MTMSPRDRARRDHELGMGRSITRRDFLNGVAVTVGAAAASGIGIGGAHADGSAYPPSLTGLRGHNPEAYSVMHAVRDGTFWRKPPRRRRRAKATTSSLSAAASPASPRRFSTASKRAARQGPDPREQRRFRRPCPAQRIHRRATARRSSAMAARSRCRRRAISRRWSQALLSDVGIDTRSIRDFLRQRMAREARTRRARCSSARKPSAPTRW